MASKCQINKKSIEEDLFQLTNHRYKVGGLLGKGAYAKVWNVRDKEDGINFALKVYDVADTEQDYMSKNTNSEVRLIIRENFYR